MESKKVVLVTGGGTGIGRATCLAFARKGATIAINYSRSKKEAEETLKMVKDLGGDAGTFQADVAEEKEILEMVEEIKQLWGRIDILVNNAGVTTFMDLNNLDNLKQEHWDQALSVNLEGAFLTSRAVAKVMKENGGGAIVNVSSIAGIIGKGSNIAYCASKAGMISVTKSLARVLAPSIRVTTVAPGFVDTRIQSNNYDNEDEYNKLKKEVADSLPLKKVGKPEDVARAIVAMAEFDYVTGQVLVVDGGQLIDY